MDKIYETKANHQIFIGDWVKLNDLIKDFWDGEKYDICENKYKDELKDATHIFSYYSCENYEGEAFVLFKKNDRWFEVNSSHCSCYGLEGTFSPEETTLESVIMRLDEGSFGREWTWTNEKGANKFADELREFISSAQQERHKQ